MNARKPKPVAVCTHCGTLTHRVESLNEGCHQGRGKDRCKGGLAARSVSTTGSSAALAMARPGLALSLAATAKRLAGSTFVGDSAAPSRQRSVSTCARMLDSSAWAVPDLLSRGCGPPLRRQNGEALVVRAPLYETGLFSVADRQLQCRAIKVDVAADAFSPSPRMRAVGTEPVESGDERRRVLDTVSGDHRAMVPWLNLLVSRSLPRHAAHSAWPTALDKPFQTSAGHPLPRSFGDHHRVSPR